MIYWRAIATVPRDGQRVVLGCANDVRAGQWIDDGWVDARGVPVPWEPTHWSSWEPPSTVAEIEAKDEQRIWDNDYRRKLQRYLIQCSYWYYVKNDPQLTDQEFDRLFAELRKLEEELGADPKSPTQMIYGDQESQYVDNPT